MNPFNRSRNNAKRFGSAWERNIETKRNKTVSFGAAFEAPKLTLCYGVIVQAEPGR